MADTDQAEAAAGREPSDLRHADDTLAFQDARDPDQLAPNTQLIEMATVNDPPPSPGTFAFTTAPEVIAWWADARRATPALLRSGADGDPAEALRFEVSDKRRSEYDLIPWDDWFARMNAAGLAFVFQQRTGDGAISDEFRLTPVSSLSRDAG